MGITTWTETQDAILLNGLKTEQTYMQIAEKLGVSKAMVSGRIRRLRKLRPIEVPTKINALSAKKSQSQSQSQSQLQLQLQLQSTSTSRVKSQLKLNWQVPSILVEKPTNPPEQFKQLKRGFCSWCLDDIGTESGVNMMCCAAPVMDKSKREGDRRSSHCVYHYEMSRRQT